MKTIHVYGFRLENIVKDWIDMSIHWDTVFGWTLYHIPTNSGLMVSEQTAKQYIKLLKQCATIKLPLP